MAGIALRGFGAKRRWSLPSSLRWRLVLTSSTGVLVAFMMGAVFLYQNAAEERHAVMNRAEAAAMAGANALDREVSATAFLAKGLSRSPALVAGDLKAFHEQLAATPRPEGSWFILWNRQGQILNSLRPFGALLPERSEFGGDDASWNRIRDRGVSIGDRSFGPIAGTYAIAVSLRLNGADGEMNGFISTILPEARLNAVLRENPLPTGWVTTILDRRLAPIGTSSEDRGIFTSRVPEDVQARLRGSVESGYFVGHDGVREALIAFHRSAASDFTAVTSLPLALVNAPVMEAMRRILLAGMILLLACTLAAFVVARQVKPVEASAALAARRLRLADARYQSLWHNTAESVFVVTVTPDGRFVFEGLNPAHERATGLTFEDVAGKEPEECLPPDVAAAVSARYRDCVETGEPRIYDEVLDLQNGRRHWQTSLAPVRDPDTGRIFLLVGTARDVTADRHARADNEDGRRLLQATLDALSAHIAILDMSGTIIAVNRIWHRFAETRGCAAPNHGVGTNYIEACRSGATADPHAALAVEGLVDVLSGQKHDFRMGYRCGDRFFQMVASRFCHEGAAHVVVAHEDITELMSARRDVRAIAGRLLSLQEEERQRIAADLHDSTAQHIVAAGLGLMHINTVAGNLDGIKEVLETVRSSLDEAQKEIRTLSYLLYPPSLRINGLAASLRHFVDGFSRRTGLLGRATVVDAVNQAPIEVQRSVLRIVQEALVNVHRHAGATKVTVDLKLGPQGLHLRIRDNGRGMKAKARDGFAAAPSFGVGIPGMEARIRQFDGVLDIASSARGTTISATIPIPGACDEAHLSGSGA